MKHKKFIHKSKTTAVVLAVLFGPFGWLYTYRTDAWKFWLNLILVLLTSGLWYVVAFVWAIIDQAIKPTEYYEEYYDRVYI